MEEESSSIQQRANALKHDLKKFENGFRAQHGRVAKREEIKADATMWSKYREYHALQRQLSAPIPTVDEPKATSPPAEERTALRERPANIVSATPQKKSKTADKLETAIPSPQEIEATPACIRHALGPTPQRDGAVLGIFDLLSSDTPSKAHPNSPLALANRVEATPSKRNPTSSDPILSRTPQSSGKRFFLTAYAGTPLKRKAEDDMGGTPTTAKRRFATPSFLRRNTSLPPIDEESHDSALPTQPFRRRQGLVRSLSTIIQGLKKQEEARMDDEWDIMNEIEAEADGNPNPRPSVTTTSKSGAPPLTLVEDGQAMEDSQAAEMPLGPDQGAESSEDDGAGDRGAVDAEGNPRKVWKKKGLKRQTKRTNMRPVVRKAGKAVELELDGEGSGGEDGGGGDGEERHDSQLDTRKGRKVEGKKKAKGDDEGEDVARKKKKVGPQDHANFRRLNIKSKNAKPKGRGGRFGRR